MLDDVLGGHHPSVERRRVVPARLRVEFDYNCVLIRLFPRSRETGDELRVVKVRPVHQPGVGAPEHLHNGGLA